MSAGARFLVCTVAALVLTVDITASAQAASGRLIPVAGANDLQNQVKTTASKVIPAVVSIASTVRNSKPG